MKTLKTLCLLLLTATSAFTQVLPDDLFVSGYVLDANGQAIPSHIVCIQWTSNTPVLPSDSMCTSTNANGYYSFTVTNGSVTGPNVDFNVSIDDPCSFLPIVQTISNGQGTVDIVALDFVICGGQGGACDVSFTSSNDSINGANGTWTFVANPTGTAPFTYDWWVDGQTYSTQTVSHTFSGGTVGVYVTVTDATGCESMQGDTLFLNGNPNQNCSATIVVNEDSLGGVLNAELVAIASGLAPFTYSWSTGETTESIYIQDIIGLDTVCVTITDANGCVSTACDVVGFEPNQGCFVSITTTVDSTGGGAVYTLTASSGFADYLWSNGATGQTITILQLNPNGDVFCVTSTDANGCTATACDTLLPINPSGCQAGFSYPSGPTGELLVGDTVQLFFDGVAGSSSSYSWTLSAGGFSFNATGMNPYYVIPPTLLPVNGMMVEICVTVNDPIANCTDTYCETVLAIPSNNNGCGGTITTTVDSTLLGVMYTFTANATGTAPYSYSWFNGEIGQSIVIEASQINWGNACVAITDATGCTITVCDTLNPNTSSCNALYSWAESNILGAPLPAVEFTDQSIGAVYWYWDFGDNSNSTDQSPLHVYNAAGTYVVCLTIVNANQTCQQTYCDTVVVGSPTSGNCSALFTNSGLTPIGYTFSANVQNPNLDYYWTIDNQYVGNGYEAYAPGFTNGVHTVCLSVVDSLNNCFDQQCQTIIIGNNNCFGYISGQAFAGSNNQPLDEGVVYVILHDQVNNTLTAVDSMVLDSSNWFFFGPLDCGDYLVKASATSGSQYYSNHIPTYHGNSPFWGFAQAVSLTQPNAQVTADVTLIAANNPGGPGFIGGDVTQGANKTDPGDPLSGMQVMLFNLSGNAIAYTYTDGNGEFGFSNVAYGTYQVYVEVLGAQTIPAVVTIGPDSPFEENVHILASESLISTGIESFDFEGAISDVYPNPVGNQATINFNLDAEIAVQVSVIDLTGRAISTQSFSVGSGENVVRVNLENLKDGYYFLNIQDVDRSFSVTRKFMRVD